MDKVEEFVSSVTKENNLGYYRIHTTWLKDRFRISVASKDAAWFGEMSPEKILESSQELGIEPGKYLTECKEALTTDTGKSKYLYAIENGSFVWKKIIDEDCGIKVRMGSVIVQPTSFVETIQKIVDLSLQSQKNLQKQLDVCLKEKNDEMARSIQLQHKLEELCQLKNSMEIELYFKFMHLLNAKKQRIKDLETNNKPNDVYQEEKKQRESKEGRSYALDKVINSKAISAYEMDTEEEEELEINVVNSSRSDENYRDFNSEFSGESLPADTKFCDTFAHRVETQEIVAKSETSKNSSESNSHINNFESDAKKFQKPVSSIPGRKSEILDFFFGFDSNDS